MLLSALTLLGCEDYLGPMEGVDAREVLTDFNFELSHNVALDVNYGTLSRRAYIEVYEENPLANATADDQTPKGTPLYTTFLDEDGSFHGQMNIPTCVQHVYVYSPSWGSPMLKECDIVNGRAKVANYDLRSYDYYKATRAGEGEPTYTVRPLTPSEATNTTNFYTINGGWNEYGASNNENQLIGSGTLDAKVITAIQRKLWNGLDYKPSSGLPNAKYRIPNVNVEVQETYELGGVTYDVEYAQVWFTMLTEAAWNENSFGYYFYELGTTPNISQLKKYIILPNVSISANQPFALGKADNYYQPSLAPAHTNMRFHLLYVDDNGNVSKRFPPKTEIGFFILVKGFEASPKGDDVVVEGVTYNTRKLGKISTDNTMYHSNNKNVNDSRYIALQLPDNSLVYGVEDGSDGSYEDMLFTITADPNLAIRTESVLPSDNKVEVPEEEERLTTKDLYTHTYAYEDVWPKGGDYDLNDVVVEHKRTYTYNSHNFVTEVVDAFTFRSVADHRDGFAIHFDVSKRGELLLPEGAIDEAETGSIILTTDVSKVIDRTLTVSRKLSGINKGDIENEELNPYIINYTLSSNSQEGRIEVHLPGLSITTKGLKTGEGNSDYYVNDQAKFPFSIRIPSGNFVLSPEGVRIDQTYPTYTGWTESHGKSNTDWYKKPASK